MALNVIALSPWGPACAVMREGPCEAAQASVWRFPHPRPRGWWTPRTEATGDARPPGLDWAAPPLPQTRPSPAVTRAPCPSRWLQAGPQGGAPLAGWWVPVGGARILQPRPDSPPSPCPAPQPGSGLPSRQNQGIGLGDVRDRGHSFLMKKQTQKPFSFFTSKNYSWGIKTRPVSLLAVASDFMVLKRSITWLKRNHS